MAIKYAKGVMHQSPGLVRDVPWVKNETCHTNPERVQQESFFVCRLYYGKLDKYQVSLPHQIVFYRKIIETASKEGHYCISGSADDWLSSHVKAGVEKCRNSGYLFEFVD